MSNDVVISIVGGCFLLSNTFLTILLTGKLKKYHREVNGMKKELVEAVKKQGEAEGNLQGRLEQTEENKTK